MCTGLYSCKVLAKMRCIAANVISCNHDDELESTSCAHKMANLSKLHAGEFLYLVTKKVLVFVSRYIQRPLCQYRQQCWSYTAVHPMNHKLDCCLFCMNVKGDPSFFLFAMAMLATRPGLRWLQFTGIICMSCRCSVASEQQILQLKHMVSRLT